MTATAVACHDPFLGEALQEVRNQEEAAHRDPYPCQADLPFLAEGPCLHIDRPMEGRGESGWAEQEEEPYIKRKDQNRARGREEGEGEGEGGGRERDRERGRERHQWTDVRRRKNQLNTF